MKKVYKVKLSVNYYLILDIGDEHVSWYVANQAPLLQALIKPQERQSILNDASLEVFALLAFGIMILTALFMKFILAAATVFSDAHSHLIYDFFSKQMLMISFGWSMFLFGILVSQTHSNTPAFEVFSPRQFYKRQTVFFHVVTLSKNPQTIPSIDKGLFPSTIFIGYRIPRHMGRTTRFFRRAGLFIVLANGLTLEILSSATITDLKVLKRVKKLMMLSLKALGRNPKNLANIYRFAIYGAKHGELAVAYHKEGKSWRYTSAHYILMPQKVISETFPANTAICCRCAKIFPLDQLIVFSAERSSEPERAFCYLCAKKVVKGKIKGYNGKITYLHSKFEVTLFIMGISMISFGIIYFLMEIPLLYFLILFVPGYLLIPRASYAFSFQKAFYFFFKLDKLHNYNLPLYFEVKTPLSKPPIYFRILVGITVILWVIILFFLQIMTHMLPSDVLSFITPLLSEISFLKIIELTILLLILFPLFCAPLAYSFFFLNLTLMALNVADKIFQEYKKNTFDALQRITSGD